MINGTHVGIDANSRNLIGISSAPRLLSLVSSSLVYADNSKICVSSLDLSSKLQIHYLYLSINIYL